MQYSLDVVTLGARRATSSLAGGRKGKGRCAPVPGQGQAAGGGEGEDLCVFWDMWTRTPT